MRARKQQFEEWSGGDEYGSYTDWRQPTGYANQGDEPGYALAEQGQGYDEPSYDLVQWDAGEGEQGLMLQPDSSLVGVSNTVTHHGAPLLSYTRTMNRFYTSRKQKLSLGRHKCEVCHERIRFWAWETPNGQHTHDGCYERMAWTWTNLYAQQQTLTAMGKFE